MRKVRRHVSADGKKQSCQTADIAVIYAISRGDLQALSSSILTRSDANLLDPDWPGMALLSHAVESRQPQIVKWLLEKGANPNTLFFNGHFVKYELKEACAEGHYRSPLARAIELGEVQSIALLLNHGAELDLPVLVGKSKSSSLSCGDLFRLSPSFYAEVRAVLEAMDISLNIPEATTQLDAGQHRL